MKTNITLLSQKPVGIVSRDQEGVLMIPAHGQEVCIEPLES
jgi:hypothetical protein